MNYVQIKKHSLMALMRAESVGRVCPLATEEVGFPWLAWRVLVCVKVRAVEVA